MNSVQINVRTDQKTKVEAQKVASSLGLNLSRLINAYLKEIIRSKKVEFSSNREKPSPYLIRCIKRAEEDIKRGDYYSFNNTQDAVKFLDKIIKKSKDKAKKKK
ncbi:MAG: type II toxin-antitoxin system RelB/DinJ family antitoxin [Candidatus Moraniibacteriota bacterium]